MAPLHDLGIALQLLTRVPLSKLEFRDGDLLRSVPWYPVVGAGVGLTLGLVGVGAVQWIAPAVGLVLVLLCEAILTGGLHDDGAADLADATGGRDLQARLRILKDSQIGAYGALALILITALRAACLWELPLHRWIPALVLAHAIARTVMLPVMRVLPYARAEGVAGDLMAGLDWRRVGVAAAVCAVLALVLAGWWAIPLLALNLGLTVVAVRWLRGFLGGVTGDALGAVCVASELLTLVVLTAAWH